MTKNLDAPVRIEKVKAKVLRVLADIQMVTITDPKFPHENVILLRGNCAALGAKKGDEITLERRDDGAVTYRAINEPYVNVT